MNLFQKSIIVFKAIFNSDARFRVKSKLHLHDNMPDEEYLKRQFKAIMGKELDLEHPKTFNEKLQWLKLYNRRPEYTTMVDKYAVKRYVADKIGEKYIIPTLGVWENFDDIDFSTLPNQFVLKCTHDSGGLVICKDKKKLNITKTRNKLEKSLKNNFYFIGREWPYKNVQKKIMAEKYMEDGSESGVLKDYKVMCFNGEPRLIEMHDGRFTDNHIQVFYDTKWNKTKINNMCYDNKIQYSNKICQFDKPELLDTMLLLSEKLAKNIPHIRVDWYIVKGRLYFGELTFFDGSGYEPFADENDDLLLGSWIKLPEKHKYN